MRTPRRARSEEFDDGGADSGGVGDQGDGDTVPGDGGEEGLDDFDNLGVGGAERSALDVADLVPGGAGSVYGGGLDDGDGGGIADVAEVETDGDLAGRGVGTGQRGQKPRPGGKSGCMSAVRD